MPESPKQSICKPTHRAILHPADPLLGKTDVSHLDESGFRPQPSTLNSQPPREKRRPNSLSKSILPLLLVCGLVVCGPVVSLADYVYGNLLSIGVQPLKTALMFTPTNQVQITPGGLDAGPAETIYSATNGGFTNYLTGGDYWVSLPLVRWRQAFLIHVQQGTNLVNITNLFDKPIVYVGTNFITNGISTEIGEAIQYDP